LHLFQRFHVDLFTGQQQVMVLRQQFPVSASPEATTS
jgi:hypothetical protein